MKIKVLKEIMMPKNMKRYYSESNTLYKKGDVIDNVSEKYRERIAKFQGTHIKIIEEEKTNVE